MPRKNSFYGFGAVAAVRGKRKKEVRNQKLETGVVIQAFLFLT
jgi:hypothetical protein